MSTPHRHSATTREEGNDKKETHRLLLLVFPAFHCVVALCVAGKNRRLAFADRGYTIGECAK